MVYPQSRKTEVKDIHVTAENGGVNVTFIYAPTQKCDCRPTEKKQKCTHHLRRRRPECAGAHNGKMKMGFEGEDYGHGSDS